MRNHTINAGLSFVSSIIRLGRGTFVNTSALLNDDLDLVLYDDEFDPGCKLVREALTELNLDTLIVPCPGNNPIHLPELNKVAEDYQQIPNLPLLLDKKHQVALSGPKSIIQYLYAKYSATEPPMATSANKINLTLGKLSASSILRGDKSLLNPEQVIQPDEPLKLYSFESSPFAKLVREQLCLLQIKYRLINLGKEQLSDLSLVIMRNKGLSYEPVKGGKRDRFMQQHKKVQVPYLEDPNTKLGLFESKAIIQYLKKQYVLNKKPIQTKVKKSEIA